MGGFIRSRTKDKNIKKFLSNKNGEHHYSLWLWRFACQTLLAIDYAGLAMPKHSLALG
jgi:hypothetical protein